MFTLFTIRNKDPSMFSHSHLSHLYSPLLHHKATLSAGIHGCVGTGAVPGNEGLLDSPPHPSGRGSQDNHHI